MLSWNLGGNFFVWYDIMPINQFQVKMPCSPTSVDNDCFVDWTIILCAIYDFITLLSFILCSQLRYRVVACS